MSIGRCPQPDPSWKEDIQFALFKTWQKRLVDHPQALAMVKEVRHQLNNLAANGVEVHVLSNKIVDKGSTYIAH